ncbi:hypothetical protein [uncultured Microscilla sp.]|uniref:hypothetical protein n=1 Tax=uncultured Microscilla sp. TaxID=432653 RepID=UPI002632BBF3|nr:hypothetical protein [uncultured Microscilla sp.]
MSVDFIKQRIISAQGQVITQDTYTILFDDSFQEVVQVKASLQAFANVQAKPKALLIADLSNDESTHKELGEIIAQYAPESVTFHGKTIVQALAQNPQAGYFPDKFSLHNWLSDRDFSDHYVLVLGGGELGMQSVIQFI